MSNNKTRSGKSPHSYSPTIVNRKARFNYELLEKLEAGMVLLGTEVKSLRAGKANLEEGFGRIRKGELYLEGCNIAPYAQANVMNHDPLRIRKLLVHRRELKKIESRLTQKGLTLVPLRVYFKRGLAKVELAIARGKTHGDKRAKIRDREMERDIRRAVSKRRKRR